jgi:hypothetical protein
MACKGFDQVEWTEVDTEAKHPWPRWQATCKDGTFRVSTFDYTKFIDGQRIPTRDYHLMLISPNGNRLAWVGSWWFETLERAQECAEFLAREPQIRKMQWY